jgi:hypothetical protein
VVLSREPGPRGLRRPGRLSERELDAFIDETIRIDDPFVTNRRVTTPVRSRAWSAGWSAR